MRIMGLDVGEKRIGVAISDELGFTAQGVEVIPNQGEKGFSRIKELAEMYQVERIVVGLPKNMNGTIGERGEETLRFGKRIGEFLSLPILFWDERLTTVAAERALISADVSRKRRKQVVDKLAATLILQNYLDSQGGLKNDR
ncbi:putative Holliday junction resolvase [[Clostridium] ultunense Esp]|uniref:Holliday junction resolvase RuvX n=1 Tax=Thermicanus aegyptius TaxID=94009 RepID=UPI0002B6FC6A|nr:Holliday junction resolvase RuvX [Thermicanus aegyptius]MBE3554926.1 Holliday junction resolvase RuvX [Thermicanus sp.]CCQ93310.1 putative Holliday junction resolvase [[Clostridium] ultunense Esp]